VSKTKDVKKAVMEFISQLKDDGKYDSITVYDTVRTKFNLTRAQTASFVQDWKMMN